MSIAAIVCTRNRPNQVSRVLDLIESQNLVPDFIIVVDSSDLESEYLPDRYGLHYLRSTPGLPYQRQIGLEKASSLGARFAVFIDDDISFPDDFLEKILEAASENPNDLIGTADSNLMDLKRPFFSKGKYNWISRGGLAYLGEIPPNLAEVGWVPGFCMAGHVDRFLKVGFPTEIRMFMEDIVFQTRFKENGRILLAPNSGLKHEPDSRGRLSDIDSTEKWDYMRERMVLQFPQYFSRRIFYLEVLMMMIADLVRMRISALGHIRFLLRTAFGRSKVYDFRNVETPGW